LTIRTAPAAIRTLVVDNYDSFTYNLCHYLADQAEADITVIRNDDPCFRLDDLDSFDCVVISPGPGRPDQPADFGIGQEIVRTARIPLLGVCLGMQGLCHALGGTVTLAPEPYHGRTSPITHVGDELFAGIPSPFLAVRYHSLIVGRIPEQLQVIARTEDGLPMALRRRGRPHWGVQFHPESICTEHGLPLLANFLRIVRGRRHPRCEHLPPRLVSRTWTLARDTGRTAGQKPSGSDSPDHLVLVRRMRAAIDAETVFDALYSRREYAFWLDSSLRGDPNGEFSFMGDASGPLARIAVADVRRRDVTVLGAGRRTISTGSFLGYIGADLAGMRVAIPVLPFDFALGWVGYLGYELKGETTGDIVHRSGHPDATMIFADRGIAFDHARNDLYLLALARLGEEQQAVDWLEGAERRIAGLSPAPSHGTGVHRLGRIRLRHGKEDYLRRIQACQRLIRAGESYEICLTNMVEAEATLDPWPAYRTVRADNPVPFGAYLRLGSASVLGCSPERFLRVRADGVAESKPIKGTRPRGLSAAEDELLRAELADSVKDRAENLMIVDLIRNDLGSCAEVGSVTVHRLFDVETYSSVHQLVSTVQARLRPGVRAADCLRAMFPGGSMTGAPKVRTMHIIDRLEGGARGVYSGCIGYFSLSGAADLSITIRTLVASPQRIQFGVGGAITALSEPEQEFEETAVKATALLSLIGQEFPGRRQTVRQPMDRR
jgi:para-aminobenzoate synthetase